MKLLYIFSIIFCITYGFDFCDAFSPHTECIGQPNGMRLPYFNDCGRFILCDSGMALVLSCRTTDPHFNKCTQRCVNDITVCDIVDCNGGGEEPTPPPETEAPPETTPPLETTPPPGTTLPPGTTPPPETPTTVFTPPTVPEICPEPCEDSWEDGACECQAQWTCMGGVCQCNPSIDCPMLLSECMAIPECGVACEQRCECVDDSNCFCNKELECPFPETECATRCGCAGNCDCVNGDCTCNEVCNCIEPPPVCPFDPSLCVDRCGCEERCLCNGNVCVCDFINPCPLRNVFMSKF